MLDTRLIEALPAAVYTTDGNGRITFFNEAAAKFWGHRPEIGTAEWCGAWRLFWPDGRPMRHDECPMAMALKEGRPIVGAEAIAERPDGSRVPFVPHPAPLKDETGRVIGGINLLVDVSALKESEFAVGRLAAIVASSEDAIVSKTLQGVITSWNAGATRIFGYAPEEMIGQSVLRIIPHELQGEEDEILAKLRRGERVEHFDTVRVGKGGRRIAISLTISPIRDTAGNIVGASKIARDITERKRSEQTQRLLFDELNHRVKNTLASIQAIAAQSLRRASSPSDFVSSFNGRIQALGRAHDLVVQGNLNGATLTDLIREQVTLGSLDNRISSSGPDVTLDARIAVQLALVLHELATNARKYGALSVSNGELSIEWKLDIGAHREVFLKWRETGVPNIQAPRSRGFGSTLIEQTIKANQGEAIVHYGAHGLTYEIRLPLREEKFATAGVGSRSAEARNLLCNGEDSKTYAADLVGTRVLLVEDEPLIAIEMESELTSLGIDVIGPASDVQSAKRLISENTLDAALVDANLNGLSVEEVAAALTLQSIPFAFVTGYGRETLPKRFRDAPLLGKPIERNALVSTLSDLLSKPPGPDNVLPMRPASQQSV
jgi:PAS domain S-box-containing protein